MSYLQELQDRLAYVQKMDIIAWDEAHDKVADLSCFEDTWPLSELQDLFWNIRMLSHEQVHLADAIQEELEHQRRVDRWGKHIIAGFDRMKALYFWFRHGLLGNII